MRQKTLEQNTAQDFAGLQVDQLQKLRNGNMTFEQVKWFNNLTFEQREELMGKQPEMVLYLQLLSGAETLMLDECDGQSTIAGSKGVFYSIDSDFKNYGANEKGAKTPKTPVEVHELSKNGTFSQIFGSVSSDLDKLCLTQDQILNFIKNHRKWLRSDGYGTFFLFKSGEQFFVASVNVASDGLSVHVHHFDFDNVWNAEFRHRFVFRQLEKLES